MSEITVIIPNRTHAFPINIRGTVVSNENSGTDIFAFVGSQKAEPVDTITGPLQYTVSIVATNMVAGEVTKDLENSKFVMSDIDGTSIGIENDLPSLLDINSDNIASFRNIPLVRGQLEFTVTVSDGDGTLHTKVENCTYTKSRSLFTTETIFLEVGTSLNASTQSVMDPEGIKEILEFKWYRDTEVIEGQTESSYTITNSDVGYEISAELSYVDGKNKQKTVTAIQNIFIVDSAPINFPIITGIPESGKTVTADTSFIYDRNGIEGEFEYIWSLDGELVDVTTKDFSIQSGEEDAGKTLELSVKYIDGAGIENTLSAPSVIIRDSAAGDTVQIVGSPKLGETLQASLETEDGTVPTIIEYEWRRGGRIIPNSNASEYTVKRADINSFLTVTIKYDPGSGVEKYKTSEVINFLNSDVSGIPVIRKVLEDGSISADLESAASVGMELYADPSLISDIDDIKDFYYPFDNIVDSDLPRDTVAHNSSIGHNTITIQRSSVNQTFIETSDEIVYAELQEIQSVYVDNSLGNSEDTIFIQYKDDNDVWKNALEVSGKVRRYFPLDQNISSLRWRLSFVNSSSEENALTYSFEAQWALESPSIASTRKFIYEWQRIVNGAIEPIVGAKKQKYLISQSDLNSIINVKVTFVDGANKIVSLESEQMTIQNYAPTGNVTIEGVAKVGRVLTAKHDIKDKDNISEQNTDGEVTNIDSYQWYLDGEEIQGATGQTIAITSEMQTKRLSVSATYTDSLNAQHTVRSRISKKVNASPTGDIEIFGTPKVGKQLVISTGNLGDLNRFSQLFYQWYLVEGTTETEISNSSLQSYVVKTSDIGKALRAKVYYTDNDGFQESILTNTVNILDSETTGEPTIEGVPLAGNTVTANISNISDDNNIAGYAYQWRIDQSPVEGATFSSFTISPDAEGNYGNYLDVVVTVEDEAGNKTDLYSDSVRIALAAGTVGTDGGTISGENISLTLQPGSLQEDTIIYIYQTVTGEDIELPEGSTLVGTPWAFTPHGLTFDQPITIQFDVPEGTNLVLRADDENDNTFEIVQNYSIDNTTATLETNTFSVYVGSVFTPAVISGIPEQGNYLTASVTGDILDVQFQWKRNGQNILNAQNDVYLLKQEDVGQLLTVAATFIDANGVSTTKTSAETQIINTPAQGEIKIDGSRRVGITLETNIVALTDVNTVDANSYTYQWFRNSVAIENATNSTYEVVENDFLKDLTVKVSFTDGTGNVETVESEEAFISKKGSVFFTNSTRKQGDTLRVDTSTLNDFYSIFNTNYSWYLDGDVAYSGEALRTRTLTTADSGKNLKVVFTYTDGRGTQQTLETDERFIHTISDTITPAGGIISGNGIKINVPAGAVSQNTNILVYVVPYTEEQLPIGTLTDEVAYAFTPLDLSFNQPVTITLPKPNDEYDMVLYGTNNSIDEFLMADEDFLTINNTKEITIQTDNFGVFMSAILYVRVDILGTPEQGQVLDTLFTGEVFDKTYQWYRGELPLDGETGTTYTVTLQDVGEEIKVISTYLLESGSSPETVESEPVLIVNSQPAADTSVIISGQDRVGQILTADPTGITDANNPDGLSLGDFLYQWKVQGQDIQGATNKTLTIQPEHFNKNITVEITYIDAAGLLESVTSDQFYITRIPPSGYVEVIGTPEVDEYLEVDTDNLVDLNGIGEFSYQWHADGVDLVGETGAALLVTSAMEDKAISVTLTYTDGVGEIETVTSRNAPVIDADPVGNVVIDYTILEVAQTLVANTSAITDANSPGGITGFTYQWKSNGTDISGATSKNYVIANQFCNTNITVTVTYTDGDGYIESLTSEPVLIVNSPVQGFPTVSGTPGVSETLTINTNNLSDVNVLGDFNYKWFADGVEIAGATEKTWVVASNSYVGKEITGQVYYVDGAGNNEEVSTSNGLTIQNSPPVGKPVVDGTFQVGQTLTVYTNEIEDFNVIATPFSFQWYVNNVAVANETGSNYVIQVNDINKYISVDASYTDEGNTLETVRSLEHLVVNTPGTATVLITNTGLEQGDILSSSVTSQDDNVRVSDYSYQWKRSGTNILGANEPTYMLGRLDWNKDITLEISFTDTGGFVETFQSENSASMINSLPIGDIVITGSNKVGEIVEIDVSEIQDKNLIKNEHLYDEHSYGGLRSYTWRTNYQKTFNTVVEVTKIEISQYASKGFVEDIYLIDENNTYHAVVNLDTSGVSFPIYSGTIILNKPFRATGIHTYSKSTKDVISTRVRTYALPTQDSQVFNYQWYRDGQMLSGSTEKTYTTTFDDLYKTLTADVSYTDLHGNVEIPNNTASFDIVNSPPEGTVLINGTRNVGEELYFTHNIVDRDNVTVDNPTGLVTFSSYQWYKSDSETGPLTIINDATGSTLMLTPELQAKWIALDATYVDIEGDDDTIHASNRLPVKSTPTGNAIITSADLQLGRQVFLDTSTIADLNDLGEFSYQWYRTEGTGSIAISGAVQTHYSFQPADLGENIYCVVSYVDGDGDQENVISNNLGPVVQTSGSIGTVSVTDRVEIGGTIESDLENIFVMNNFETVAPVVAYNFHSDTRDVGSNQLHLAGTNYSFDEEGGLDLSHSTSAYLRTAGTTPVLNNDTHTIAFRVKRVGLPSGNQRIFTFGNTKLEVLLQASNNKILFNYNNRSDSYFRTNTIEENKWYDIVLVKKGNIGRVYVDGILIETVSNLLEPATLGQRIIEFGWTSNAAPVIIKDFQIFDFAVDDYTSVTNYPFYTEPTLSLQWKADGNPIAGATGSVYQVPENNTELGKDITLEVSLTDALGNARTLESGVSTVVGSDLIQLGRFLLEDGSEILQEDGSSFLSETTTTDIFLPLSINGQKAIQARDLEDSEFILLSKDDGSSTTEFKDYSNNNHSITRASGHVVRKTDQSKFSGASIYFDGSGERLETPHNSSLNIAGGDWTIEAWIYPDGDYGTYRTIISKRYGGDAEWQLFLRSSDGVLSFYNGTQYNSTVTPAANQWSHVAAVRSGTTVTLYLNGENVASWNNIDARNSTRNVYVGGIYNASECFKGYIDSIRVSKKALYTQNFDVPTTEFATRDDAYVEDTISVDTSNITDPNGLAGVEYQWYADNSPLLDATGSSYVITQEEINKDVRVKAVFEDETGRKSARLSDEVLVINTPATGSITITSFGTFEVNNVLYANPSISDDNGIVNVDFDYQWMIDGANVSGENQRTYVLTNRDVGKQVSVKATFVDKGYTIESITSDSVEILNSTGTGEIQILGQSSVGSILTADTSDISDPNDISVFSYQWKRDGVAIDGATSQSYTLVADDYNKNITVDVTYTDGVSEVNTPTNTASVYVDKAAPTGTVSIEGTREVLNTLTATNTIEDLDGVGTLNYQWYRGGNPIAGATSSTFDLPRDYVGSRISVTVSYLDGNSKLETFVSDEVEINNPPYGSVTIVGTAKKGEELYADALNIVDTNNYLKANSENLVFDLDAIRLEVKDSVSGNNGTLNYDAFKNNDDAYQFDGSSDFISFPDHQNLDFDGEITVSVWFKPYRNDSAIGTLVGKGGEWSRTGFLLYQRYDYVRVFLGNGSSQAYEEGYGVNVNAWNHVAMTWKNNTIYVYINGQLKDTIGWSNGHYQNDYPLHIGGWANGNTYNFNGEISQVRIYDSAKTSEEIEEIFNLPRNELPLGYTSHQWQREVSPNVYENISGATSKRYTPTNSDVYKKLRVITSYTDQAGFNESVISEPVYIENTLPTGAIAFSGTRKTGNTIVASISNVSDANVISSIPVYQWNLDGVPVGGDSNSYTIASNDVGKELSLTITFVDSVGTIESVTTIAGTIENSNPTNLLKWSNPSKNIVLPSGLYQNIQTITNPFPNSTAWFGYSVAISGDGSTMVVGSHGQDRGYTNNGAIYIYTKNENGQWQYIQEYKPGGSNTDFGVNVDINYDGSVIVAGASGYDYDRNNNGAAFVYTKNNNGTWTQAQRIMPSDREWDAYFGRIVSVSDDGNTIAVGAYTDDVSYADDGAVYIYTKSGSTWGNEKKIYASRRNTSYLFGFGLSLSGDGNTLAVGAHGEYYSYDNDGAVYMFTKDTSGNWTERQRIMFGSRNTNDYFGYAVKLSQNGDVLVVGSHGEDNRGTDSGAAYVYTRSGDNWNYVQELVPQGNDGSDNFGVWLSMTPDSSVIAVGAYKEDTTASDSGAVYIFIKSANTNAWTFEQKIKSTQILSSNYYGYGIDLSDDGYDLAVGQHNYSSGVGLVIASSLSPTLTTDSSTPFALYNGAIISLDVSDIVDADSIIEESKKYKWYRIENSTETLISENREYKIRDEDLGKSLKAEFEYLDGGGTIQALNLVVNVPTDNLQIDGDLFVGNTVSIEDNLLFYERRYKTLEYEWTIGGKVVSTESTYEIKPEDLGQHLIAKRLIYVDGELQNVLRTQGEITLSRVSTSLGEGYQDQIFYDFTKYTSTNSKPVDLVSGKNITYVNNSVEFSSTDGATFTHGSSDSLRTDVLDVLNNDYHTIALRIKFNANYNGTYYKIFSYGQSFSNDRSPGLWWHAYSNGIHWKYNPNNTGPDLLPLDINRWYDIVGVKDGGTLKIYVDGVLVETTSVSNPKSSGNSYISFGRDNGNNSAPMSIKKATIIPQALSEEQIKTVFDFGTNEVELKSDVYQRDIALVLQDKKYIPSPPSGDYDYYGRRGFDISGDGNTLVIGASLADNTYTDSGAVYIYERQQDGSWGNEIRLMPPSQQHWAQWGHAVKLNADGTTLAVVAPYHDNNYADVGYTSIYRKQVNGSWLNVYNRNPYRDEQYGQPGRQYNIDISDDGNIVVVGADREDGDGYNVYNEGRFHIYEYYNGSWNFVEYEPTGDNDAYTGFSVSISGDGNYIVVGAPYYDGHDQGLVWIYKRNGVNNWSNIQGIRPESGYRTYNGWKVSFSSDSRILAISARYGDQQSYWSENRYGRVYVYERKSGSTWSHISTLADSTSSSSDYFGDSLVVSGDGQRIVVGTPYRDEAGTDTGKITIFKRTEGTNSWERERQILGSSQYPRLGEFRLRTNFDASTILAGYNPGMMFIEQNVEIVEEIISIDEISTNLYKYDLVNENTSVEYYIDYDYETTGDIFYLRLDQNFISVEKYLPRSTIKVPKKVSLPFIETVKEQLLYSNWYSHGSKLIGTDSSIDLEDSIIKFGNIKHEYAYKNYKNEIIKDSSTVYFVRTKSDSLEYWLKHENNFSLDLNTIFTNTGEFEIAKVEILGGFPLPSWLSYNTSTKVISGIPSSQFVGNISLHVLLKRPAYKETILENFEFGVVLDLKVRANDNKTITSYKQYDWAGIENPNSFVSTYGLTSTRNWDGKFQISSAYKPFWDKEAVIEENFDANWTQEQELVEDYPYNSFKYKSYYSEDLQFLQDAELNTSPSWSGEWQIHNRFVPNFEQHAEKQLEENFDDLSWSGYTRVDWANVEDRSSVSSRYEIDLFTEVEERFQWASIPKPTFAEEKDYIEEFEDNSWTGFTRVDWYGIQNPSNIGIIYGINAYWQGKHHWGGHPQPQFAEDKKNVTEQFDDSTWSGYTRIDWNDTDDNAKDQIVSSADLGAFWEGQFKWSERAQPSFADKSLVSTEDFDEDWTI